jgi:hypothetical protein
MVGRCPRDLVCLPSANKPPRGLKPESSLHSFRGAGSAALPRLYAHRVARRPNSCPAGGTACLKLLSVQNLYASGGGIDAQHFHKVGDFAEVAEGILRGFVVAAQEVDVEDVLPRTAAHGARLDLAQADVAQCEDAE